MTQQTHDFKFTTIRYAEAKMLEESSEDDEWEFVSIVPPDSMHRNSRILWAKEKS